MPQPPIEAHRQSQMSLFDAATDAAAPAAGPEPKAGRPAPPSPRSTDRRASPPAVERPHASIPAPAMAADAGADASGGSLPGRLVTAPGAVAGTVFRHPRTERELRLGDHLIGYAFRRARRRSIGFVVGPEGLSVSAPRWVTMGEVDTALQSKAGWIVRKLQEQRARLQKVEASRIEWRDGASVPFLGEPVILVLDPRVRGAIINAEGNALPGVPRLTLHVGLPHTATPEQIKSTVTHWLQRQARRVFEERCQHFAPRLGVRMRRLSLSSAHTRWGSASADGSIRLHWRLIHFRMPVIDYVVAHELAHLREMNHSPAFWAVVRSVLPDYEAHRGTLKDHLLPAFD